MTNKFLTTYIVFSKNKLQKNWNIFQIFGDILSVVPHTLLPTVTIHANDGEFKLHVLLLLVNLNCISATTSAERREGNQFHPQFLIIPYLKRKMISGYKPIRAMLTSIG